MGQGGGWGGSMSCMLRGVSGLGDWRPAQPHLRNGTTAPDKSKEEDKKKEKKAAPDDGVVADSGLDLLRFQHLCGLGHLWQGRKEDKALSM